MKIRITRRRWIQPLTPMPTNLSNVTGKIAASGSRVDPIYRDIVVFIPENVLTAATGRDVASSLFNAQPWPCTFGLTLVNGHIYVNLNYVESPLVMWVALMSLLCLLCFFFFFFYWLCRCWSSLPIFFFSHLHWLDTVEHIQAIDHTFVELAIATSHLPVRLHCQDINVVI